MKLKLVLDKTNKIVAAFPSSPTVESHSELSDSASMVEIKSLSGSKIIETDLGHHITTDQQLLQFMNQHEIKVGSRGSIKFVRRVMSE